VALNLFLEMGWLKCHDLTPAWPVRKDAMLCMTCATAVSIPVRKDAMLCMTCATAVHRQSIFMGTNDHELYRQHYASPQRSEDSILKVNWETLKGGDTSKSIVEKQWLRLSAMCRLPTPALA